MPRSLSLLVLAVLIAGCASGPPRETPRSSATTAAPPGKYYLDDGPGLNPPPDLDSIPDAVPRLEPLHRAANRPYAVFGREYIPATTLTPYRERGIASWYGRKFHGQKTSTGEPYDMYAMTAAHPTLPLPSYARVTSVASGKSVVVRVNDRGPFLHDRIIDLSYAAAHRLGIAQSGSGEVDVEAILPGAAAESAQAALPPLPTVATAPAISAPLAPASELPTANRNADAAPVASMRGGYSVQLGAFANFSNAKAFLARTQNQLATAQVEPKIRQAGGLYRVYIGPYPARSDAARVGQRISQAFGFPTTVADH
ncbi:MAG TPA: septal ring lytic transglycosylase RlpA family protein [Casimicrobiaceae bacterium]|jgi:rare lipoprotein A